MLNRDHPLTDGLEGLWLPVHGRQGGSRLYDLSGYGRHGDITQASWVGDETFRTPALDFDGSGDYVSTSYTPSIGTLFFGCSFITNSTSGNAVLISIGDSGSDGVHLFRDGSTIELLYGGVSNGFSGGPTIAAGQRYDISIIKDGADAWIVLDDTVNKVFDNKSANSPSVPLDIGGNVQFDKEYFNGVIGNVFVNTLAVPTPQGVRRNDQARRGFPSLLNRRDQSALYVSTAGAVTGSVTDTLSLSDSRNVSGSFSPSRSDTITLSDTVSASVSLVAALSDTLNLSDDVSGVVAGAVITASVTDTLTLSDSADASLTVSPNVSDNLTLSDSLQVTAHVLAEVSDTLGLSDTISVTVDLSASVTDTLTLSDVVSEVSGGGATVIEVSSEEKYKITVEAHSKYGSSSEEDSKYYITLSAEPLIE